MGMISAIDVLLFLTGVLVGTAFSYSFGKFMFSRFYKKQLKYITVQNTVKFEEIQQIVNYMLGFALGSATINLMYGLVFLAFWICLQTWLAVRIFHFREALHGFSFVLVDTGIDIILGTIFGAGASSLIIAPGFELIRLAVL